MPISNEDLMRYLDDEMPPDERARVEEELARSTELQRDVAVYRAMRQDLGELSDVDTVGVAAGDTLVYNGTTSRFEAALPPTSNSSPLESARSPTTARMSRTRSKTVSSSATMRAVMSAVVPSSLRSAG